MNSKCLYLSNPICYLLVFLTAFAACDDAEEPQQNQTFTLSTTASPTEGGEVKVSPSGSYFDADESVSLTAEPNSNWVFQQWEGDGSGSTNPLALTMNSNKSVTAVFVKRDYPLNLTIEGEGTIGEKIITNPSAKEYPHGTTVELTPIPAEGWAFESWGGDLSGDKVPQRITVDGEANVTVVFKEESQGVFYLDENGITCKCEGANPGDKGFINGVEYEAVDNTLLRQRRDEDADMTKLCTSLVTLMIELFQNREFNQPIGNWDVSNVANMHRLFFNSTFNQPIGAWDVSNVVDMEYLFGNSHFNQDISNWNVTKVRSMNAMFSGSNFNQPVENWNVANVEDMRGMFLGTSFNQPLNNWDVSNVTHLGWMFRETTFNYPIDRWDVSKVKIMGQMFWESSFNQPIGNWDVGQVTNMDFMFSSSPFNQPLENWDVSNVTRMESMFTNNNEFNQDLSSWCVLKIPREPDLFDFGATSWTLPKPIWGTCPD